jgi:hypothetical protein
LALGCFGSLGLYAVCMAFTEDLSVFFDLQGFGVPVVHEGVTGVGILDMPSEMLADGVVLSTDYKLTVRSAVFNEFLSGDTVTVDGVSYKVRNPSLVDDGKITEVMLMRV